MKKIGLFLLAALTVVGFSACNDDDGDYPTSNPLITPACPLDGCDYYFKPDNGHTLEPSDNTRHPGYRPPAP